MSVPVRALGAACAVVLFLAACVEVPDSMHAAFAPAGATEASNFRIGPHGSAPPADVGSGIHGAAFVDADAAAHDAGATSAPLPDAGPAPSDAPAVNDAGADGAADEPAALSPEAGIS